MGTPQTEDVGGILQCKFPQGLAAGTGAWTTDWPTQHRSQLNHWVRGAAFKPLYSLGVLPSWARNPVLGQRTTQPKGYPARNPPPRDIGSAKREDQTHRVHQSAMVQGLMPSGGPENGEGSHDVTSHNPKGFPKECLANDRSPRATTHLERPPTGCFLGFPDASPLFQSDAPGEQGLYLSADQGGRLRGEECQGFNANQASSS